MAGSIPPEMGDLLKLRELDLSNNQLGGTIPPEIGRITRLDELNLSYNRLTGELPPVIGKALNMNSVLDLSQEPVDRGDTGLGEASFDGERIGNFDLSGNELTGEIPAWLGQRRPVPPGPERKPVDRRDCRPRWATLTCTTVDLSRQPVDRRDCRPR